MISASFLDDKSYDAVLAGSPSFLQVSQRTADNFKLLLGESHEQRHHRAGMLLLHAKKGGTTTTVNQYSLLPVCHLL
jgi:hypothetical protein